MRPTIEDDLTASGAAPLVLDILSEGENYGYAIVKRVRALSGGRVGWGDGMIYPLLRRLRRLGYVTAEWRHTAHGRRRRYYTITQKGREAGERWSRKANSPLEEGANFGGSFFGCGSLGPRCGRALPLRPAHGLALAGANSGAAR